MSTQIEWATPAHLPSVLALLTEDLGIPMFGSVAPIEPIGPSR